MMKNILLILFFITFNCYSGIVINGTRFIYSQNEREIALSIENPEENTTYLIQSWIEKENYKTNDFILTPPLFKLNPQAINKLRIMKTKPSLQDDKETLYWLHIKSLPSLSENIENSLHIVVKSSFKLFYRPESLSKTADSAFKKLLFNYRNHSLTAKNPTGHYITLRELRIDGIDITDPGMIAPFSELSWEIPISKPNTVYWNALNDYGGKTQLTSQKLLLNNE